MKFTSLSFVTVTLYEHRRHVNEALRILLIIKKEGKLTQVGSNFTVVLAEPGSTTPRNMKSSIVHSMAYKVATS